eukprot:SAG22_NODE_5517_length_1001_cov_0.892461_1_plen_239_part_10
MSTLEVQPGRRMTEEQDLDAFVNPVAGGAERGPGPVPAPPDDAAASAAGTSGSAGKLERQEAVADAVPCPAGYPLTRYTAKVVAYRHAPKLLCLPCFFASVRFMQWFRADQGLNLWNLGTAAVILALNIGPLFLWSFRRVTREGGQLQMLGAGTAKVGAPDEKRLRYWALVFLPPCILAALLMPVLVVVGILNHFLWKPGEWGATPNGMGEKEAFCCCRAPVLPLLSSPLPLPFCCHLL